MKTKVVVDTGPLVSFLDHHDNYYSWITDLANTFAVPWLVCEPVLTEAWFLLRRIPSAQRALLTILDEGLIKIDFALDQHMSAISDLCQKYSDLPMSLADACIVLMAEAHPQHCVCTIDRDFLVYRRQDKSPVKLIAPFSAD